MSTTVTAVNVRSYTKPSAQNPNQTVTVFVYAIQGSKEQREHYVQAVRKQINQRTGLPVEPIFEDNDEVNGRPLFFTPFYNGENITIGFKFQDGTPFMDNSGMAKMGSIVAQAERTSPMLAKALADRAADHLLGINSNRTLAPNSTSREHVGANRGDQDGSFSGQGNPEAEEHELSEDKGQKKGAKATADAGSADPDSL